MANYDNVRQFVINALRQYHAQQVIAEGEAIATVLADYPTSAEWDSTNSEIIFKHGNNVLNSFTIDGANFVRDGMIDSVSIENYTGEDIETYGTSYLYVNFNTDAESQNHVDIKIPLESIFNPNNYYTKSEVDNIIIENERVTATALVNLSDTVDGLSYDLSELNSYVSDNFAYLSSYVSDAASELRAKIEEDEEVNTTAFLNINNRLGVVENDIANKEDFSNKKNDLTVPENISATYYATTYSIVSYVGAALGDIDLSEIESKIDENAEVAATALLNLNDRINEINAYGYITNAAISGKEDVSNKKTSLSVAANISESYYPTTSAVVSYIGELSDLSQAELNTIFGIS